MGAGTQYEVSPRLNSSSVSPLWGGGTASLGHVDGVTGVPGDEGRRRSPEDSHGVLSGPKSVVVTVVQEQETFEATRVGRRAPREVTRHSSPVTPDGRGVMNPARIPSRPVRLIDVVRTCRGRNES